MNNNDVIAFLETSDTDKNNNYKLSIEFSSFPYYLTTIKNIKNNKCFQIINTDLDTKNKINFINVEKEIFNTCITSRIVCTPKKEKYLIFGKNIYFTFGFVPDNFLNLKYEILNDQQIYVNDTFTNRKIQVRNYYFDIGMQLGEPEIKKHKTFTSFYTYKRLQLGLFLSDIKNSHTEYFFNLGLELHIYTGLLKYRKSIIDIGFVYKVWYNFLRLTISNFISKFDYFYPIMYTEQYIPVLRGFISSYTTLKGISNYLRIVVGFN